MAGRKLKSCGRGRLKTSPKWRCFDNIVAVLRHYEKATGLQLFSLILIRMQPDRCIFQYSEDFAGLCNALTSDGYFIDDPSCHGYRENVPRYAMEITFHGEPPTWPIPADQIMESAIEIDFDYWNPCYGIPYAIMHLATEVIPNFLLRKRTNPFKVAKGLRERGIEVEDVRG